MEYDPLHLGIVESDLASSVAEALERSGEALAQRQLEINHTEMLVAQRTALQRERTARRLSRMSAAIPKPARPIEKKPAPTPEKHDESDIPWQLRGACRDEDPELFFSVGKMPPKQAEQAKAICRRCKVIEECFKDALKNHDVGVRGNTTYEERREISTMRRRRAG